jgi:hypothetical protein
MDPTDYREEDRNQAIEKSPKTTLTIGLTSFTDSST